MRAGWWVAVRGWMEAGRGRTICGTWARGKGEVVGGDGLYRGGVCAGTALTLGAPEGVMMSERNATARIRDFWCRLLCASHPTSALEATVKRQSGYTL